MCWFVHLNGADFENKSWLLLLTDSAFVARLKHWLATNDIFRLLFLEVINPIYFFSIFQFFQASESPFVESTSPNPTLVKYAATTESLHTYGSYLMQCLPKFIQQISVLKDELTLYTGPSGVIPVLTFLRDHSQCQFKSAVDISGADYPEREKRFEVVYHLLSIKFAGRIRVKTYASEADPVPTSTDIFRGADWYGYFRVIMGDKLSVYHRYEREAWDLYGIFFEGHPDL